MNARHDSVLLNEVIAELDVRDGNRILDATVGQGGHSEALMRAAQIQLIALDADQEAVACARERLDRFTDRVLVIEGNFRNISKILAAQGIQRIDRALFDLGWNRGQLVSGRGFSFQHDEPLVMSYGLHPASGFIASDILNTWSEEAIANVLFGYAGERYARRIAKNIVSIRLHTPVTSTRQLVLIVEQSVPASYRRGRIHCATKTFQALRIAVNDELGSIEHGLRGVWEALSPHGRMAVITFHSLEDALTKKMFNLFVEEGGILAHKKPIVASHTDCMHNPAARSAKLRVIIKP